VTTIAGSDSSGYSGDGGPAVLARLNTPHAIAADWHGNVYIADAGNHCIRKVLTSGEIVTVAGTGVAGFSGDGGIASGAQLNFPCGVAVDSLDNIYIADSYNNCIRKINTLGVILTIAGQPGLAGGYWGDGGKADTSILNYPNGIVVDPALNIYFADMLNARVRMIDTQGYGLIYTVAGMGDPGYWGDGGNAKLARLNLPASVAFDYNGNLFVADMGNQRVREVNQYGTIFTVAGNGTQGYNGDGIPAWSAELYSPQGVGVGPDNNVYVADYGNFRIRKLDMVHAGVAPVAGTRSALTLYPNPAAGGEVSLLLTSRRDETLSYSIMSVDGSVCGTGEGRTNVARTIGHSLPPGTYFVTVTTQSGTVSTRLVQL
jgi:internalin A